jgi:arylsulfatase A-like enzyme
MPSKPNIVFIFSDQQRYDTLSCYGNDWIQVPNLNALANQGQRMIGGNFSQIDLVPTLLDLLGESIPDNLHGVSRADVLTGDSALNANDVFMEHNGVGDRTWAIP